MTLSNDDVLKKKLLSLYPNSSYLSYWLEHDKPLDEVVNRRPGKSFTADDLVGEVA